MLRPRLPWLSKVRSGGGGDDLLSQRTRLRRICAKLICVVVQIYVVKKAYNKRKFAVKPSQRRYFAMILRQKKICTKRVPAYRGICVEFTRIFCSVLDFFAQFLVHFLFGCQRLLTRPRTIEEEAKDNFFRITFLCYQPVPRNPPKRFKPQI